MFKKKKPIVEVTRNDLFEFSILLLGSLLCALGFNLFLMPNNIVIGISGLSVISNSLWGLKPSTFLFIAYAIMLLLSFIFLGFKSTKRAIVGSIIYPLLVEATSYIVPYFNFGETESIVLVMCGALLNGFGSGLVYKVRYSTGGTDIVNQLISKFIHRPIGTSMMISSAVIIVLGFLTFGMETVIYSIVAVYIISVITDKVMIGISSSKSFYIITEEEKQVEEFLLSILCHGVTIIPAKGAYSGKSIKMIFCIAPTKEYIRIKENVLNIDKDAKILVSDTYEVLGTK